VAVAGIAMIVAILAVAQPIGPMENRVSGLNTPTPLNPESFCETIVAAPVPRIGLVDRVWSVVSGKSQYSALNSWACDAARFSHLVIVRQRSAVWARDLRWHVLEDYVEAIYQR